jgi:hypothetical protein
LQKIHKILSNYFPESSEDYMTVLTSPLYCQQKDIAQTQDTLRSILSEGAFSWVSASFDVLIVGSKFEIWRKAVKNHEPVKEINELESLFRKVRIDNIQQAPEKGLWFSACVDVYPDGKLKITRFDAKPPKFLGEKLTTEDYRVDLLKFLRSSKFIPTWLKKMMKN